MSGNVVHCQREAFDVYIGRGDDPRMGRPGEWGNPYSHRPSRVPGVIVVGSRQEAIRCYRIWLSAAWAWRRLCAPQLFAAA